MAGRYGQLDYSKFAKRGFLLGACLFAIGALGELIIAAADLSVPGWEQMLLVNMEVVGILAGLLLPLFFGIVLPLTE